jgi:hypothetical protein
LSRKRKTGSTPPRRVWGQWIGYETVSVARQFKAQLSPEAQSAVANKHDDVIWKNGVLAVMVEPEYADFSPAQIPILHLSLRTEDRKPFHDWRWFQRAKSELCGWDTEGVELYPSEARLLDGSNQYHLYVFPPGVTLPWGIFGGRSVADNEDQRRYWEEHSDGTLDWSQMKGKQRDWAPGEKDIAAQAPGVFQRLGLYPEWQYWRKTVEERDGDT